MMVNSDSGHTIIIFVTANGRNITSVVPVRSLGAILALPTNES